MLAFDADYQNTDGRRSEERLPLRRPGTIRFDGGGYAEAMIVDLNCDGCRITTETSLSPYAKVTVGIAHLGGIGARVVWYGSTGYGCAFDAPLSAGAVAAAFGGSNLAMLPKSSLSGGAPWHHTTLSARQRVLTIASVTAVSWGVLASIGWAAFRMSA